MRLQRALRIPDRRTKGEPWPAYPAPDPALSTVAASGRLGLPCRLHCPQPPEDPHPRADALVEAVEVVFLVGRMDIVVVEREADHHAVHAQDRADRIDH